MWNWKQWPWSQRVATTTGGVNWPWPPPSFTPADRKALGEILTATQTLEKQGILVMADITALTTAVNSIVTSVNAAATSITNANTDLASLETAIQGLIAGGTTTQPQIDALTQLLTSAQASLTASQTSLDAAVAAAPLPASDS